MERFCCCGLTPCQFTGCSFGVAAISQYESLKSRFDTGREEAKANKELKVRVCSTSRKKLWNQFYNYVLWSHWVQCVCSGVRGHDLLAQLVEPAERCPEAADPPAVLGRRLVVQLLRGTEDRCRYAMLKTQCTLGLGLYVMFIYDHTSGLKSRKCLRYEVWKCIHKRWMESIGLACLIVFIKLVLKRLFRRCLDFTKNTQNLCVFKYEHYIG